MPRTTRHTEVTRGISWV